MLRPDNDARRQHLRMRRFFHPLFRMATRALTRLEVRGLENIPPSGPLILAFNHLGHLDPVLLYITMPVFPEIVGLSEAFEIPLVGWFVRAYGGIPVHRDQFDRAVVEQALQILRNGWMLALAPEARFSTIAKLEQARTGVAYLAMKSGAPVLPIAITGTEKLGVSFKRLCRAQISLTYGTPLRLPPLPHKGAERRALLREQSDRIMRAIAAMLPDEYRGVYKE